MRLSESKIKAIIQEEIDKLYLRKAYAKVRGY